MTSNIEGAANMSIKQSWTADKEWSSSLGLGEVLTTPTVKTGLVTKQIHEAPTWTHVSVRPKQWKWNMMFGTKNVMSLNMSSSLTAAVRELAGYK